MISTHFDDEKPSYKLELVGDIDGDGKVTKKDIIKTPLKQNGDFRSPECIEILKDADIVVTNPPFSLFREYIAQLIEYEKRFIVLGNNNAITYKEIFPLIKDNKLWLGYNSNKTIEFRVPDSYKFSREDESGKYGKVPAISWFTNLETKKRKEDLILFKKYDPKDYPKYDNYDAIEVSKVAEIPCDYDGIMGVPITFLDKYNPDQFEIVGLSAGNSAVNNFGDIANYIKHPLDRGGCGVINGDRVYARFLIKRK